MLWKGSPGISSLKVDLSTALAAGWEHSLKEEVWKGLDRKVAL
jgi:hypothetical protein